MTFWQAIWRRITTTRYARSLEAEIADERAEIVRLRAENRALLNSILGIAGIPPITVDERDLAAAESPNLTRGDSAVFEPIPTLRENREGWSAHKDNVHARQAAAPLRRRSWQQISRAFEIEAAMRRASPSRGTNGTEVPLSVP